METLGRPLDHNDVSFSAQLNTKDILFICGGAFVNLDRLVAERTSTASLGFGNPVCISANTKHQLRL